MRGHVESSELVGTPGASPWPSVSPRPIGQMLPAVYQDDDFAQRFTRGIDEVIAPIVNTLDNLTAYFDPATTPTDFLEFLSCWVGIELEDSWTPPQRRRAISRGVVLNQRRGTAEGLREALELVVNAPVEVIENGATAWSQNPGADLPGQDDVDLLVRIDLPELSALRRRRIDALIASMKPACIPHRLELGPVRSSNEEPPIQREG